MVESVLYLWMWIGTYKSLRNYKCVQDLAYSRCFMKIQFDMDFWLLMNMWKAGRSATSTLTTIKTWITYEIINFLEPREKSQGNQLAWSLKKDKHLQGEMGHEHWLTCGYRGKTGSHRSWYKEFCWTWLDLEITILSEVSQTEKDKYHMISLICRI